VLHPDIVATFFPVGAVSTSATLIAVSAEGLIGDTVCLAVTIDANSASGTRMSVKDIVTALTER